MDTHTHRHRHTQRHRDTDTQTRGHSHTDNHDNGIAGGSTDFNNDKYSSNKMLKHQL